MYNEDYLLEVEKEGLRGSVEDHLGCSEGVSDCASTWHE